MVSNAASSGLLLMAPFGKASSKSWLEATLRLDSRLLMLITLMLSFRWNWPPSPCKPQGKDLCLCSSANACKPQRKRLLFLGFGCKGGSDKWHSMLLSLFDNVVLQLWVFWAVFFPELFNILQP